MKVKVLGTGCSKCHQLTKKIKSFEGSLSNLEIKVAGRVPTDKELKTLLGVKDD